MLSIEVFNHWFFLRFNQELFWSTNSLFNFRHTSQYNGWVGGDRPDLTLKDQIDHLWNNHAFNWQNQFGKVWQCCSPLKTSDGKSRVIVPIIQELFSVQNVRETCLSSAWCRLNMKSEQAIYSKLKKLYAQEALDTWMVVKYLCMRVVEKSFIYYHHFKSVWHWRKKWPYFAFEKNRDVATVWFVLNSYFCTVQGLLNQSVFTEWEDRPEKFFLRLFIERTPSVVHNEHSKLE